MSHPQETNTATPQMKITLIIICTLPSEKQVCPIVWVFPRPVSSYIWEKYDFLPELNASHRPISWFAACCCRCHAWAPRPSREKRLYYLCCFCEELKQSWNMVHTFFWYDPQNLAIISLRPRIPQPSFSPGCTPSTTTGEREGCVRGESMRETYVFRGSKKNYGMQNKIVVSSENVSNLGLIYD